MPFILPLISTFQSERSLFFVLKYAISDLHQLVKLGNLRECIARNYVAEIILAIEGLHKHDIIWRDLKSANILIDHDGHVLASDFGLSKMAVQHMNEGAKSFCG